MLVVGAVPLSHASAATTGSRSRCSTCMATEALLSWFDRGKVVNLQSAYISGISLTLLIKPQGGALWPFVLGGFLAIASKYVLRYRDNHLWNPTNFAISALLLAAPDRVSVLSHQFGNDLVDQPRDLDLRPDHRRARAASFTSRSPTSLSFLLLNALRAAALGISRCCRRSRRSPARCISCSSSS